MSRSSRWLRVLRRILWLVARKSEEVVTRDDGREEVILSDVRPLPAWASYATKMTQERADEVRSEVAAMNGLSNERGRGDSA